MSIAEKFEVIADAVYEKGIQNEIANSKYIPKRVSGKIITLTDVSEVAHTVKVYGDNVNVDVYGKNLFDGVLELGGISGVDGGNMNINGVRTVNYIPIIPNTTYTISREITDSLVTIRTRFYDIDKNYIETGSQTQTSQLTLTTKDDYCYMRLELIGGDINEKVQVEFGNASPYEPYTKQTLLAIPEEDDLGEDMVKVNKTPSICPVMNFFADSDITVDYFGSFGMQESQNRFADSFQVNGARQDYTSAFYGSGWNDYTFEQAVNYDIVATICNQMFYNSKITDLASLMEKKGISIIFEGTSPNFVSIFQNSTVTHIPELIMPEKASATKLARGCKSLHTIDGLVCNENTKFDESFLNCENLIHCIFSGVIASNIDLHWSNRLDRASILSLLQTLTATVAGVVATLPSMCIDGATDTLAMIQGDTELNTAYTQALANGYTITFV